MTGTTVSASRASTGSSFIAMMNIPTSVTALWTSGGMPTNSPPAASGAILIWFINCPVGVAS